MAAGGLLAAIVVAAAFSATPAGAATLPTPTDVTATPFPGGAEVDFSAPTPPTTAVVYAYTITASPGGATASEDTAGAPGAFGIGGLTNGVTYTFTVTISDASGDKGAPSAPSNQVTPELDKPPAPDSVTATPEPEQAQVAFQEDGVTTDDAPVTGYTVTASPGGKTASGTSSPITLGGLTDGTSYTFTVTASSSQGPSPPSTASNAVTPLAVPSNATAPAITGDPQVDEILQVGNGIWTGSPDSFGYTWSDCAPSDPTSCSTISGVVGSEYTVQPSDLGFTIQVQVSATNADNEMGTATTAPTAVVTNLSAPVAATPPSVTGDPLIDDTVHADPGSWTEGPNTFTYQWYDCDPVNATNCSAIDGATGADYTVTAEDGGSTLEVAVTATNLADLTAASTTAPTATVTALPGAPEVTTLPTVGSVDGGEPVSGTHGGWSNSPTSFTYTWISCAPDFSACFYDTDPSSTLIPYSPTTPDSGSVLLLEVVATNSVGDSVAAVSDPSAPVAFPPPTITVLFPVDGASYLQSQVAGVQPQALCTPALGTQLSDCEDTLTSTSGNLLSTVGTDSFQIFASDDDGGRTSTTVTYTVTAPALAPLVPVTPSPAPSGPATPMPLPFTPKPLQMISAVKESSAHWRAGNALPGTHAGAPPATRSPGTDFSFSSSTAGQLQLVFRRQEAGRKNGPLCVAPTRANRHRAACIRLGPPLTLPIDAGAGENYVSFDGRVSASSRLKPGSYVAKLELAGTIDVLGTLRFTILK